MVDFKDKYLHWLKNYFYVGGMPEVVSLFLKLKIIFRFANFRILYWTSIEGILGNIPKKSFKQELNRYGILFRLNFPKKIKNIFLVK